MNRINVAFDLAQQAAELIATYHADDLKRMNGRELVDTLTCRIYPVVSTAMLQGANLELVDLLRGLGGAPWW